MGGRIALSLALDHASRVERLVLAATSAHTPRTRVLSRRWIAMELLSRLPTPGDGQPRWVWKCQRQASSSYNATTRLAEITAPTLILHGRRDHLAPPALARELNEGIPGSVLVEVPGGHISLVTHQRQRFINEVTAFVTS